MKSLESPKSANRSLSLFLLTLNEFDPLPHWVNDPSFPGTFLFAAADKGQSPSPLALSVMVARFSFLSGFRRATDVRPCGDARNFFSGGRPICVRVRSTVSQEGDMYVHTFGTIAKCITHGP